MTDTPATIIRPAVPGDAAALGRLGALLVQAHHDFDPRRFMAPTAETPHGYGAWLMSQLRQPRVVVLVAESAGEVVGYAYAGVEGTDWMALRGPAGVLYDVVVDPAHRGRGTGRALVEAAVRALEAFGAPRIVLSTAERNEAAQRLFASAGFRRTMIEMTREADGDAR
ncbi:MAG TPA: GNAT family N-acetyltransferase [Gemmatimonadales bacterium]|nr:GNAT family N-acetyltransferase [Gemmatimonadales bacterium]